jgi:hypothetical protein
MNNDELQKTILHLQKQLNQLSELTNKKKTDKSCERNLKQNINSRYRKSVM